MELSFGKFLLCLKSFGRDDFHLPKSHLTGCQFFRFQNSKILTNQDYLSCIELIKPLLKRQDFKKSTPGFYINYRKTDPTQGEDSYIKDGGLRLTYYTVNAAKSQKVIQKFVRENEAKITLFDTGESYWPDLSRPIKTYDEGKDPASLKFRNTLNISTQIALDLLESDTARTFENPITNAVRACRSRGISPTTTLDPIFSLHSSFFRELKKNSLDQDYWNNLVSSFPNGWPFHILANTLQVPE